MAPSLPRTRRSASGSLQHTHTHTHIHTFTDREVRVEGSHEQRCAAQKRLCIKLADAMRSHPPTTNLMPVSVSVSVCVCLCDGQT